MLKHLDSDIISQLSQGELTALRYIDAHKEEVLSMSIQETAAGCYLSTATVLRLCKKIGLSGYSELKYMLKGSLLQEQQKEITGVDERMMILQYAQVIENTCRLIDVASMAAIVRLLLSPKKIHLYAGGLTFPVLEYLQRFLLSAGRPCFIYATAPLVYRATDKMGEHDVLIIASTSGATPSVTRAAQIARNSGAFLISLTTLNNSPLSKLADINLYTMIDDRDYYGTDIKSRASLFFLADVIMECYLFALEQEEVAADETDRK